MTADIQLLPEEPIEELGTRLAEGGAASEFLYIGESGLWRLRLRDAGWEAPALVAPEPGYDGFANYPCVWNERYLSFRNEDESLRIVPLDGRDPFEIDDRNGGFCFLPGGERLLVMDDEDARIHDLKAPGRAARRLDGFHKFKFPYHDGIDDPAWLAFVQDGKGGHHLAAGCYGYFACWPARLDAVGLPVPAGPPTALADPFAYDHVRIRTVGPGGALWIDNVSGGELQRFATETGKHAKVPVHQGSEGGNCYGVLPSPEGGAAWVRTKENAAIWRPTGGLLPLPDKAISAVAYRGQDLWHIALGGEMLVRLDLCSLGAPEQQPDPG